MDGWNDFSGSSSISNSFEPSNPSSIDWGEQSRTHDTDYSWEPNPAISGSSTSTGRSSGCGCLLLILLLVFGGWIVLSSSKPVGAPLQSINLVTPITNIPVPCFAEIVSTGLNVRSGPEVTFSVVDSTSLVKGMRIPILAVHSQTRWLKVRLPNGKEGWVSPYPTFVRISCAP